MKLKTILSAMIFGGLLLVLLPLLFISANIYLGFPVIKDLQLLGVILILSGFLLVGYCISLFFRIGQGTPVPAEPPKKLVIRGIYKYSRNPIYIAWFVVLVGEFLTLGYVLQLVYAIITLIFFNFLVIYVEEPKLKSRFGKEYLEYIKTVPRWL